MSHKMLHAWVSADHEINIVFILWIDKIQLNVHHRVRITHMPTGAIFPSTAGFGSTLSHQWSPLQRALSKHG